MFNWVIAEQPRQLFAVYDELAQRYAAAGVRAWTVWADEHDQLTADWVRNHGHTLDAKPRAMAADIATLSLPSPGGLAWQATADVRMVAAINDQAYDFPPPAFTAALVRSADPRWRAYLAYGDEEDVGADGRREGAIACVLCFESVEGDCGVTGVATLPAARGTGTASRLLAVALREAAERGAQTTTLQATSKGAPVYARLGYRDLGAMIMWEHRVPKP